MFAGGPRPGHPIESGEGVAEEAGCFWPMWPVTSPAWNGSRTPGAMRTNKVWPAPVRRIFSFMARSSASLSALRKVIAARMVGRTPSPLPRMPSLTRRDLTWSRNCAPVIGRRSKPMG